jgi:putative transcriptional regulator
VDLTAKLLIAMPGMGDPRFDRSVIFMCAHSPDGAMGLIVNKPTPDLAFDDLLEQLGIESGAQSIRLPIHVGGPVDHGRGFVLHSADYRREGSTLGIDDRFGMTATLEILEDIAKGDGPRSALLALGYAGWGPGQLEGEIQRNGWLTCDAREALVFATPDDEKWAGALNEIGVDARLLSPFGGRA